MPITKCEASKATPAKGIDYILDPEKVIASGSQGFISNDPVKMAAQMVQTMHLFGKGYDYNERKYYHAKVSFNPADRLENGGVLTVESANRYAADYAKALWPNREVVWAVQDHGTSIHIHFVIAACEQTTGKNWTPGMQSTEDGKTMPMNWRQSMVFQHWIGEKQLRKNEHTRKTVQKLSMLPLQK